MIRGDNGEMIGRRRVTKFVWVWRDSAGVAWAVVQCEGEEQGFEIVRDVGVGGSVRRLCTPALEMQDRARSVFM